MTINTFLICEFFYSSHHEGKTLETAPATTAATLTPAMRKRRHASISHYPTHPTPRVAIKEFWTARIRKIPSFVCNPWDFYKPFLKLGSGLSLVLCNNETEIRVMRIFNHMRNAQSEGEDSEGKEPFPLLEIQHPNFVDLCEAYLFKDEIFAIVEYVGFSIADLLQYSIYPSECELAYITSQVCRILLFLNPLSADIAGLGWDTIHLVTGSPPSTHICGECSHLHERRCQDR